MEKALKKILLILCALMVLALCGCGGFNKVEVKQDGNDGRMKMIYNDGWCLIYQGNETGVQYFSRANCGSCVMVNADGTPYTGG